MSLLIRVYMDSWLIWIFLLLCRTVDVSFVLSSKEQLLSRRDQCSDIACGSHSVLFSSELKVSCCYGLILMVPKGPCADVWVTQSVLLSGDSGTIRRSGPSGGSKVTMGMFLHRLSGPCFQPLLAGCSVSKFLLLFCFHHQALPHCRVPEPLPMETSESVSQRRPFNLPSLNLSLSGTCHSRTMLK